MKISLFQFALLHVLILGALPAANLDTNARLAAEKGLTQEVEAWLVRGGNVHDADQRGRTASHYAAVAGKWELVDLLFTKGYDPLELVSSPENKMVIYQRGQELLGEAAKQGQTVWIERLLKLGLDPDSRRATSAIWADPVCLALAAKHGESARVLIEQGAAVSSSLDIDNPALGDPAISSGIWIKVHPIHLATLNRDLETVQLLVRKGADIESFTDRGSTALMLAAQINWVEGLRWLLKNGANRRATDVAKKIAWEYGEKHPEIRHALLLNKFGLSNGADPDPAQKLVMAIDAEDLPTFHNLIQDRAVIGSLGASDVPPLHYAVTWGRVEYVRELLAAGADPNQAMGMGYVALGMAVRHNSLEILKLLIEAGADPNRRGDDEWRALDVALHEKRYAMAEYLIEHGASLETLRLDGEYWAPPVVRAADRGQLSLVKLMLAKGAKLDERDSNGCSALTLGVQSGNSELVEFLLNQGMDVNATAKDNVSPLSIAIAIRSTTLVRRLLAAGAKPVNLERAMGRLYEHDVASDEIRKILSERDQGEMKEHNFWAATRSREEIMAYIKEGGSPNYGAKESPLRVAIIQGDYELANFLLDHGADPNFSGHVIGGPLGALANRSGRHSEKDYLPLARRLLELGAKPDGNSSNPYEPPPMWSAIVNGSVSLVELLLAHGADKDGAARLLQEQGSALRPETYDQIRAAIGKDRPVRKPPVKL